MPVRAAALSALLVMPAAASEGVPVVVDQTLRRASESCAAMGGGPISGIEDALQDMDLTGDGAGWAVDFARLDCPGAASFACGSGGCRVVFAIGNHRTERMAQGWQVVAFGDRPVILVDVHGSLCGGINPTPCVEALVWDADAARFSTLAARPE